MLCIAGFVREQDVELNPKLLFMRVKCVIIDRAEMAKMEFEFIKHPRALFEKGSMYTNVKKCISKHTAKACYFCSLGTSL